LLQDEDIKIAVCDIRHIRFLYRSIAAKRQVFVTVLVGYEYNIGGKKFKRTNIVAAKCGSSIVAPMIYDGATDAIPV